MCLELLPHGASLSSLDIFYNVDFFESNSVW